MDLIDRKRIKNGLPKYDEGLSDNQINDPLYYAAKIPIPEPKLREPSLTVNVPKYKKPGPNLGNIANLAGAGIQGLVSTIEDFYSYGYDKSVQDLNNQAGTNQETTNGVTYTTQNFIGDDEYRNAAKQADSKILGSVGKGAAFGASAGSIIPGIGTGLGTIIGGAAGAISGFFGGNKAKREARRRIEEQRQQAAIRNDFARGVATTKGLNLDYIREHGNTETQQMWADGKVPEDADSLVSPGETIARRNEDGSISNPITVPGDPSQGDVVPFKGSKDPNLIIYTKKYNIAGISKYNPYLALDMMNAAKESGMLKKTKGEQYKCGKMPKYDDGMSDKQRYYPTYDQFENNPSDLVPALKVAPIKPIKGNRGPLISLGGLKNIFGNADSNQVANAAIHAIGAGIGLDQYRRYKNEQVFKPDTFAYNQFQDKGLKLLASQDINAYPIMRKLDQQRAWTDYMLNNSGGLSGAQKYLGRIANSRNTQSSIADMLSNIGLQRNQLRANYANALLTTGAQEAQNRMAANKYDTDMFMRSHAARQQGMDTGIYNMLNNAQSYLANKFKYDQFLKTYGLYSTDLNNKRV